MREIKYDQGREVENKFFDKQDHPIAPQAETRIGQ